MLFMKKSLLQYAIFFRAWHVIPYPIHHRNSRVSLEELLMPDEKIPIETIERAGSLTMPLGALVVAF